MLNPFWGQRWWETVRDKTPLGCSCERKLVTGWILRLWCLISSVTSKTCPHWWRANQVSTFACLGTEETHMDKQRLKRQQLQVAGFLVFLGQRSHTDLIRSPQISMCISALPHLSWGWSSHWVLHRSRGGNGFLILAATSLWQPHQKNTLKCCDFMVKTCKFQ